jgi:hypothetical protein
MPAHRFLLVQSGQARPRHQRRGLAVLLVPSRPPRQSEARRSRERREAPSRLRPLRRRWAPADCSATSVPAPWSCNHCPSPAFGREVDDLGACPSSRTRSKIVEWFSPCPHFDRLSLVLWCTTGAIWARCEPPIVGELESHSTTISATALLGRAARTLGGPAPRDRECTPCRRCSSGSRGTH